MRKLSLPVRILLAFLSFVLGVALFASVVVTALIADIQIVTSQDTIQSLVTELLSGPAHLRVKVPTMTGEGGLRVQAPVLNYQAIRLEEAEDVASDLTQQLIDMFYDQVAEQLGEEFPVSKEEFTEMVQDSTVKDYISEKTAGLITDYFNDTVTTTFEPEEIVQLIQENAELIESITQTPIPEDIAEQVAKVFDENEIIQKVETEGLAGFMEDEELDIPVLNQLKGEEGSLNVRDILNTVRDFASQQNLIYGIIICVVLIAAILLVNAAQLPKGLRRAGYPLLIAGLPVVVNLLALYVPDMWTGLDGLNVVQKLFQQTAIVNIIVFGSGFVLLLSGIILGITLRVKAKIIENKADSENRSDEPVEVAAQVFDVTNPPVCEEPEAPEAAAEETSAEVSAQEDDILTRATVFADEAPAEEPAITEETPASTPSDEAPAAEVSAEETVLAE